MNMPLRLTALNISYNKLSGAFPAHLTKATTLTTLYLSNNQLSGEIPTSITNLTKLGGLDISNNCLFSNDPNVNEFLGKYGIANYENQSNPDCSVKSTPTPTPTPTPAPTPSSSNVAPVASFTATPRTGVAPLSVSLNASASSDSDGSISNYAWSTSDGKSASGSTANLSFSSADTVTITLTVTDNQGATATHQKTITVAPADSSNAAPVANFSATPTSGAFPLTVALDASSSSDSDGRVNSYAWSTSDGQSDGNKQTSLTFNSVGSFVITLTVTDEQGKTANKQVTITATTPTGDTTPDSFNFSSQNNLALGNIVTSESITVAGITAVTSISVKNGEYRINGGSWSKQTSSVKAGDQVQVRLIASDQPGTAVTAILSIGGVSGSFTGTTGKLSSSSASGNSMLDGYVYDSCTGEALASVELNLTPSTKNASSDADGYYQRSALAAGSYTLTANKTGYQTGSASVVLADKSLSKYSFNLTPVAPCEAGASRANRYKAIILAGGGATVNNQSNDIWPATLALADKAYQALKQNGFDDEHIRYLSAGFEPRYPGTGNVNAVDDSGATLATLENSITQWAATDTQDVVIYLMSHGGTETLYINNQESLSATKLKDWLEQLSQKISGKLLLVVESCYSASFVKPLKAPGRYLIASSDNVAAIANAGGSTSFSYYFWSEVAFNGKPGSAFKTARQAMSKQLIGDAKTQKAFMDNDGSGSFSQNDYRAISSYCVGSCKTNASLAPTIESIAPSGDLAGVLSATLSLQAKADHPLTKAWVTIQRPDYDFPGNEVALSQLPQVSLSCQQNRCTGDYRNFNLNGDYLLSFYVQDSEGNVSLPSTMTVKQSKRNDTRDAAAEAFYDFENGQLTVRDVSVGGRHWYIELLDQGGYAFKPTYWQPLTPFASTPSIYDDASKRLSIPSVFAKLPGSQGNYAVEFLHNGDFVFRLQGAVPVP